jgi:PAS domain S-box-containing protein
MKDIGDRELAYEALRQSESRYRILHETMRDGFVRVSMEGKIIEFNRIFQEMLGYSPDELRTLTYQEITPERWYEFESRLVREQIIPRGYSDIYEKEYRRKDGAIFPAELRTILSSDDAGRLIGMWATVRDVTERKNAEAALRSSEELNRRTLQALPAHIAVLDREGRVIATNRSLWAPATSKFAGTPPPATMGPPPRRWPASRR